MTRLAALICAAGLAWMAALPGRAAEEPAARVEARSEGLLAVGLAHGERMSIHVTQVADNAPVRDATVTVMLRGVAHPAVAEPDGSYTIETKDLALPGPASVAFLVTRGATRQSLEGTLSVPDTEGKPSSKNSARQLWWWVLNFAVCIGFLMLMSRRRKASKQD